MKQPETEPTCGLHTERLARRAQRLMMMGLLASFIGTQFVDGVVTGLVALGVFPVLWIPLYRTLTEIQDAFAAVVSRVVERFSPGRVLQFCEAVDIALCITALIWIAAAPAWTPWILLGYLVIASPLPLLVDLAEEYFLNDIGRVSAKAALSGSAWLASTMTLAGLVLGRAAGVGLSEQGAVWALLVNMILSGVALALRWASARSFDPRHERSPELATASTRPDTSLLRRLAPHHPRYIVSGGPFSPLVSLLSSLASAICATYLLLWVVQGRDTAARDLALLIVVVGLVNAGAPWVVKRYLGENENVAVRVMTTAAALTVMSYAAMLVGYVAHEEFGGSRLWVIPGLVTVTAATFAFRFALMTARRLLLDQVSFKRVIGWSMSLSAAGSAIGSWLGWALGAHIDPGVALVVAAFASITTLPVVSGWISRRRPNHWTAER